MMSGRRQYGASLQRSDIRPTPTAETRRSGGRIKTHAWAAPRCGWIAGTALATLLNEKQVRGALLRSFLERRGAIVVQTLAKLTSLLV